LQASKPSCCCTTPRRPRCGSLTHTLRRTRAACSPAREFLDADPYNAAKHGLAIRAGQRQNRARGAAPVRGAPRNASAREQSQALERVMLRLVEEGVNIDSGAQRVGKSTSQPRSRRWPPPTTSPTAYPSACVAPAAARAVLVSHTGVGSICSRSRSTTRQPAFGVREPRYCTPHYCIAIQLIMIQLPTW
jgi:hypothetical protein